MNDGSGSGRAVNMRGKRGVMGWWGCGGGRRAGGAALTAEREPTCPPIARFHRLDLQVLAGTLAEAVPENKNRCRGKKTTTPLRLGFASGTTPAEMRRV